MKIKTHWVSERLIEVAVDEIKSDILDADQAKELAQNLIDVASELLQVKDYN